MPLYFLLCISLSIFLVPPCSRWLIPVNKLPAFSYDPCLILLTQLPVSQWGPISYNSLLLNWNALKSEFLEMILWDTINYPKLKSHLLNKVKKRCSTILLYNKVSSIYRENKNWREIRKYQQTYNNVLTLNLEKWHIFFALNHHLLKSCFFFLKISLYNISLVYYSTSKSVIFVCFWKWLQVFSFKI